MYNALSTLDTETPEQKQKQILEQILERFRNQIWKQKDVPLPSFGLLLFWNYPD
jgi:hypothetical protein